MAATHEQDHPVPVPYVSQLLQPISAGQTLVVHGKVNTGAERFAINFLSGCLSIDRALVATSGQASVPLHINARFDEKKIVLNSLVSGQWGKEERHSNMFTAGEPFDLRIRVHDDKYELWANQKHFVDFSHRLPHTGVDHLQVEGDVTLTGVHWGGRYFALPVTCAFHGESLRQGQRVYVYGVPKGDFSVNFIGANGTVQFHFNPRFIEKTIVRNSQNTVDSSWGSEEREGAFPFKKDTVFDLVIHNEPYSLQLFLDGKRIGTFAHRVANPDLDYKSLRIEGEVELTGVEVSH